MAPRDVPARASPGVVLPALERIAPPPPLDLVEAAIESRTRAGDVVLDLHGTGGWIARSAIERQRRAIDLESSPLSRLLAEVVLRPPDVRHLDAAFRAIAVAPHGTTGLREAVCALFASSCPTCGGPIVVDELAWEAPSSTAGTAVGAARPARKHFRCPACRDQRGGPELRTGPVDDADVALADSDPDPGARPALADRFPVPAGAETLVDDLLDLHTPRQLAGLAWVLRRIEGELRAEPIEAVLRLALLHAILPASRLRSLAGRTATLRVAGGRVRSHPGGGWRERNPWLAFEDGFRLVRAFVQDVDARSTAPVPARFGPDPRSLAEGTATVVVAVGAGVGAGPGEDETNLARAALVVGRIPARPTQERLAVAFHGTAWALGREAAARVPVEPLLASSWRLPWAWQAAAVRRALEAASRLARPDAGTLLVVDEDGEEELAATVVGAAAAGFRIAQARLPDGGEAGIVDLVAPGAALPPGPRTRGNVPLPTVPGGAGDPGLVPGRGVFAAPERVDARPFSEVEAARAVTDAAVEVLVARGEPLSGRQLFGPILVALDRAGHIPRLVADRGAPPGTEEDVSEPPASVPSDAAERLVGLVRDELGRRPHRRLVEVEPDRWWLADRDDLARAATPLADRVEWAVYSFLSTAGPIPAQAFRDRIAAMFTGHDRPDAGLVEACLDSYRGRAATDDGLVTDDDLLRRSTERAELLALLADAGHRLGMRVWLARSEHGRTVDGSRLDARLTDEELRAYLPIVTRAPVEDLEAVDCIWYVRNRMTLMFELEWTAMIAEAVLRHHARIPTEDRLVRFLVIAPERTELVRLKIERSPILRSALATGNWHIVKSNHLRAWLARDELRLDDLEPYLGLDPVIERGGEQLALFEA